MSYSPMPSMSATDYCRWLTEQNSRWLAKQNQLRAAGARVELRCGISYEEDTTMTDAVVDAYSPHLAAMRAAEATTFEGRYKATRLAALEATRAALAAETPAPRALAEDLAPWAAPNGYAPALEEQK